MAFSWKGPFRVTPPYRIGFAAITELRALHTDVLQDGQSNADLDVCLPTINYATHRRNPSAQCLDRWIQSPELFQAITTQPSHRSAYINFSGEVLPWELDHTSGSYSPNTQRVLDAFDRMVENYRQTHRREGRNSLALAREIFSWVTRPRLEGGLGMLSVAGTQEMRLDVALDQRRGDCSEFGYLLLMLYSRAGYSVRPHWVGRDMNGDEVAHLVTELSLGNRRYLMDPVYGNFNAPHQRHVETTYREMLAWYWNNRATNMRGTNPSLAQTFYRRAIQIDPQNPFFYLNRGISRIEQGRPNLAAAERDFRRALQVSPGLGVANQRLGNLYYDRHEYREALVYYRRAVAGDPRSTISRHNLIMTLGHLGRIEEAGRQFEALRRLEPNQRSLQSWLASLNP